MFCLIALAPLAPRLAAAVIIEDTFAITASRTAGSTLAGSTTEIGGATWASNDNSVWVLGGDATNGYVTSSSNSAGVGAAVPFKFSEHTDSGSLATLSVTASLPDTTTETRYFSFGFTFNSQGIAPTGNANVWVKIYMATNTWELLSRSAQLATGTFNASINLTNNNTFSLSYDESKATVTDFSINGTSVASGYVLQNPPSSKVAYVSIYSVRPGGTSTTGDTRIDAFSLSVTSAIPEPGTYALLLGTGLLLAVGVRKISFFRKYR